jgi:hypothetical protein
MSAKDNAKRSRFADRREILRYGFPNLLRSKVALSQRGQLWLEILKREGIARIEEEEFRKVADHLDDVYFSKLESKSRAQLSGEELGDKLLFARDSNDPMFQEYGADILCEISFRDPALSPLLLNPDISGLCYNYYRRQPYYRNQPVLQRLAHKSGQEAESAAAFHVDRMHQISLMLLLSDVTEKDTHMEYVLRSQQRRMWKLGIEMSEAQAAEVAKQGQVMSCIGEKGTLYIFDASGVHRRCLVPGSTRKIFHCNVTTGHHLRDFIDHRGNWEALEALPPHTQRMFSKLKR